MKATLDEVEVLCWDAPEQAEEALRSWFQLPERDVPELRRAARMAESLGLSTVAMRAWQRVVGMSAEDEEAWRALAALHDEAGACERAEACYLRVAELRGDPAPEPSPKRPVEDDGPDHEAPSAADVARFVVLFSGREGVHARMWHEPSQGTGYSPIRQPLTAALVEAHLQGSLTLGSYLVRADDTVAFWVLDLDAKKAALERARGDGAATRALRAQLHEAGLIVYRALRGRGQAPLLVDSGFKGRHLWGWLDRPTCAAEVRAALRGLVATLPPLPEDVVIEIFPKQDRVPQGGLGNLVKLPLGLHLRSERRAVLLDDRGEPLADPWPRLRAVERRALPAAAAPRPVAGDLSTTSSVEVAAPPLPPALPERPWTEVDFDVVPRVRTLLDGCNVLREVVSQTLRRRTMSRDAAVVLEHSMGHLPEAVDAVNYLYDLVPGFPHSEHMGAPHRGSPVGCAKIRSRLPEVVERVPCQCAFAERPGAYANPLRHLDGALDDAPPAPQLDDLLAVYARTEERLRRVSAEHASLRGRVVDALSAIPDGAWLVPGGEWRVESEGGLPVLSFVPAAV